MKFHVVPVSYHDTREVEIRHYKVIRIRSFPGYFESTSKNEMPQITVVIWTSSE